jgi:hypothetical protein
MTTFTLLIFLAYASSNPDLGGSVALDNQRVEFFSKEECDVALREVRRALNEQFKRSVLVCVRRGAMLLDGKG